MTISQQFKERAKETRKVFSGEAVEQVVKEDKEYTTAICKNEIENLKEMLYKNPNQECNCRGWDNAIKHRILHWQEELELINNI